MKSLMRIYIKYIATALLLILAFIILQLGLIGLVTAKVYSNSSDGSGKYSIRQVYDALDPADDPLGLNNQEAVRRLEKIGASFAMLLDDRGNLVWTYRLPDNLNHTYTTSQIASFTHWYLDGYPISVWGGDKGLLVAGYPRGSVWLYNIRQDMANLERLMTFFSLSFVITVTAALIILLASGYRYYRKMRVMSDSINQLASGRSVHLAESGTMKEIAGALNRTSDRLARQREQLEQRDEARTQWISGVSHDIRTPLSLVMGYAEMIESQPGTDGEIRRKAGQIRRQSMRIRGLIEDLNLTSKLEYNVQPLRLKTVCLAAILRRVAADLLNSMERPQDYPLSIQIKPGFEAFSMEGDEQLLFRAFQNILGNSVKHNENGCDLEIRAWLKDGRPCVRFCDNGCGIPQAIQLYIDTGQPPQGEIHLMGLRIVRQIITAHRGEIRAQAEGNGIWIRF